MRILQIHRLVFALSLALLSAGTLSATLLTPANESQLEAWLGEGDLAFANLFTSVAGDGKTGFDFVNAVAGKGRTFTLIDITSTNTGIRQIVGGYLPRSWTLGGGYVDVFDLSQRTAFLFNLTDGVKQAQSLDTLGFGSRQFAVSGGSGPWFGGGPDLYVAPNLSQGSALNYSYGGTRFEDAITSGNSNGETFLVHSIEVYNFQAGSSVPEAGSPVVLLAVALAALVGASHRGRSSRSD